MRSYFILSLFLSLGIFLGSTGCKYSSIDDSYDRSQTKYVGGIQINEANQTDWAKNLRACGLNMAQVTAYANQGDWDSDQLWWDDQDTTHVINEIRAIKAEGVHVMMVLRVALQHNYTRNKFKWHGMIYPRNRTMRNEWFARYGHFVEMWAKICEREGVDIFAIGSEMNALTATEKIDSLPSLLEYFSSVEKQRAYLSRVFKHKSNLSEEYLWVRGFDNYTSEDDYIQDKIKEQKDWADAVCHAGAQDPIARMNEERDLLNSKWKALIGQARKQYSGQITLAANFDNYQEVDFWGNLDFIGINAYFPLRSLNNENYELDSIRAELVEGWIGVLDSIEAFKQKKELDHQQIFFTEIGYTSKADCTINPWQGDGFSLISNGPLDTLIVWKNAVDRPEERTMAMQALHEVVNSKSFPLLGLSYWKMTSHEYHRGHEPFLLHLDPKQPNPMIISLSKFLK